MPDEASVDDLVCRWRMLRGCGQTPSVEDLCADCPDLLDECRRRLQALASMEAFLGLGDSASRESVAPFEQVDALCEAYARAWQTTPRPATVADQLGPNPATVDLKSVSRP